MIARIAARVVELAVVAIVLALAAVLTCTSGRGIDLDGQEGDWE